MLIQTDASIITQEELDHIHRMTKIARSGRISAQARTAKRRNQVRILREALGKVMACVEAEWGADFLPYNLAEPADAQANAAVLAARAALEATKD